MHDTIDEELRPSAMMVSTIQAESQHGTSMLFNVHLLRGLAALAVVFYHITSEAGLDLPFNVGAHGVDVFFVISGFIMPYTSARAPERFFLRRLIRIVPFYWAASLLLFGVALIFPNLLHSTQADFVQLFCSLFFIPRETAYAGLYPTLILGWSLNYEIYFYALFAVSLAISRRWSPILCAALIAAVALGIHASKTNQPTVTFYARPLVFEFCYGIAAYYLFCLAKRFRGWIRASALGYSILWILAIGSICCLVLEEYNEGYGLPRFIAAGAPAFVLVTSALLLEQTYGVSTKARFSQLLGESSYILYLIHPYIIYTILRVILRGSRDLSLWTDFVVICALLSTSTAAAMAIHTWFEKPMLAHLRARLIRPVAPGKGVR